MPSEDFPLSNASARTQKLSIVHFVATIGALCQFGEARSEGTPMTIESLSARESESLNSYSISLFQDAVETMVLATSEPQVQVVDWGSYVLLPIGEEVGIECYAYNQPYSLGYVMNRHAEAIFSLIESVNGAKIQSQSVRNIETRHQNGHPIASVQIEFELEKNNESVGGSVTVQAALIGQKVLACVFSEYGYRRTFTKVVDTMVANAKYEPSFFNPIYSEFSDITTEGQPGGFIRVNCKRNKQGGFDLVGTQLSLLTNAEGALVAADTMRIEGLSLNGELQKVSTRFSANSELVHNLSIQQKNPGQWTVAGQQHGENVEAIFEDDDRFWSTLQTVWEYRRRAVTGDRQSFEFEVWDAVLDARKTIPAKFRWTVTESEDVRTGVLSTGTIETERVFSPDATPTLSIIRLPDMTITYRLVWSDGELPAAPGNSAARPTLEE